MRYYGLTPFPNSAYTPTEEELERVVALSRQLHDYARTLSSLANSHRKINRLPQELIVRIFKEVRGTEGWEWLRLLLVCREWRAAGLSDATLWSDITLQGKNIGVKDDFLEMCLVRSKNAPLSVAFKRDPLTPFRFKKIDPHLYRLRELQLRDLYHGDLKSFLDGTTCEFPTLTSFVAEEADDGLGPSNHAIVLNSTRFPKLRFLAIKGVIVDASSSVLLKLVRLRLQELKISGKSLAFLISRCTSLEHLDLQDTSFLPSDTNSLEYASDTGGPYSLNKLKTLFVSAPHFRGLYRHLHVFQHRVQIPFRTDHTWIVSDANTECRNSTIINDHQLGAERSRMTALMHNLVLLEFPPGFGPAEVNVYICLYDSSNQARLAVTCGSIFVKLQYDLRPSWQKPTPHWGDSDLDELGRILQGIPARQLNIDYGHRTTCQDEGGWRAFLANFPDLQSLSVHGSVPLLSSSKTGGAERVLEALQPRSEEHAGSVSEDAFVCKKLQKLVIEGFEIADRDRFDANLSRMIESRKMVGMALQQVQVKGSQQP
ncbi:hypothetical protein C8Q74DRAFT_1374043 [Fomes fomentarius]|nr:hypothetical protein C8Q74DRAFT_1374043 [Fomes fomentarius]